MIRPIDPDEAVTVNGFPVTGRQLAEARQELSHRGVHNPRWAELSQHDQDMAALSAGSWLRALTELVAVPDPNTACAAHDDAHLGQPCPDRMDAAPAYADRCPDGGPHLWVGRDGRPATGSGDDRCDACGAHRSSTAPNPGGAA